MPVPHVFLDIHSATLVRLISAQGLSCSSAWTRLKYRATWSILKASSKVLLVVNLALFVPMVPASVTCTRLLLRERQYLDLKVSILVIKRLDVLVKHVFTGLVDTLQNMVASFINSFATLELPLSQLLVDLAHSYIFIFLTLWSNSHKKTSKSFVFLEVMEIQFVKFGRLIDFDWIRRILQSQVEVV